MQITDRRILLFPILIALGAWISVSRHSSIPVLVAGEIGFLGLFFLRTPVQKKIISNAVIGGMMVLLLACIALAAYLHR